MIHDSKFFKKFDNSQFTFVRDQLKWYKTVEDSEFQYLRDFVWHLASANYYIKLGNQIYNLIYQNLLNIYVWLDLVS